MLRLPGSPCIHLTQDVFAYDLLLVPVNHDNAHWTLAAVWPATRHLEHFCSLGGETAADVLRTLALYLDNEAADKSSPSAPPAPRWTGCRVRAGVPRQRDGSACGVFVVAMAARLAAGRRPPFDISQGDVPALRLRIAADCLAQRATPV
jgi:sentrin-specific protease 1